MFRKILVPLDGSPLSEMVLPEIEKLVSETNAEVTLLTVADSPAPIGATSVERGAIRDVVAGPTAVAGVIEETTIIREGETQPQAEQRIKDELGDYLADRGLGLAGTGTLTAHAVLLGDPAEQIVAHANDGHFDLIAMATHGRSGLSRLFAGSVASRVVERASIPVLLVGPGKLSG